MSQTRTRAARRDALTPPPRTLRREPRFACLHCGDEIPTDQALAHGTANGYHRGCGGVIAQLAPPKEQAQVQAALREALPQLRTMHSAMRQAGLL